jgi:UDP-N-acetylmuramyl pentapeptide phosphotransferase/UDP-N-acetylglucosamine-1-phosphate transferase
MHPVREAGLGYFSQKWKDPYLAPFLIKSRSMDKILLAASIAFIITFAAIPVIIQVSDAKKLFDIPDERKVHLTPIPSLGGLGIFAGFIMACLVTINIDTAAEFQFFFAAALVIFFLGLKDDILVISPIKKFIGQLIAAFLIIFKGGIIIHSMHGFMGIYELPEVISIALTYFTVIVVINSINLIDGVDGLAGSLGLLSCFVFGVYFYYTGHQPYATMAFAVVGSLLGFLIFNHSPARIFMGDTGSLMLVLVNAILAIHFINVAANPVSNFPVQSSPAMGIAILMVPLFDTLRVFSLRILNRRSPFSPDRNHVHHLLLDRGFSHSAVTYTLFGANVFFIAFAYFLRDWDTTVLLLTMLGIACVAFAWLYYSNLRSRLYVTEKTHEDGSPLTSANVFSLKKKPININPEDN